MTIDSPSPLDLVIEAVLSLIATGLVSVGCPAAIAAVLTPWLPALGVYLRAHLRDHLAERLPALVVPPSTDLEGALLEELDRLVPPTIPAPPPGRDTADDDDEGDRVSYPADSLLSPGRRST